jgi:hypothetical protein
MFGAGSLGAACIKELIAGKSKELSVLWNSG